MIRITDHSLIIEIPSTSPLEDVGNIQKGLLDLIGNIDHSEVVKSEIQNALVYASKLLKEMLLNNQQNSTIQFQVTENSEIKTAFAA